jgi:hypothetical protein
VPACRNNTGSLLITRSREQSFALGTAELKHSSSSPHLDSFFVSPTLRVYPITSALLLIVQQKANISITLPITKRNTSVSSIHAIIPCTACTITPEMSHLQRAQIGLYLLYQQANGVTNTNIAVTRSHKTTDRDHAGLANGTAAPEDNLPKYFGKAGYAGESPSKTKKQGGGKSNW